MSTKKIDKDKRTITETHETGREGVVLVIETSHYGPRGEIHSRAARRKITPLGYREKFSMASADHAPAGGVSVPVERYSFKQLEGAHDIYVAWYVASAAQITALKEWAERF